MLSTVYLLLVSSVQWWGLYFWWCCTLYTDWFYLFNTTFFWPQTCPHPRKIVLGLGLENLSSLNITACTSSKTKQLWGPDGWQDIRSSLQFKVSVIGLV